MMFPNLKAEMARVNITAAQMAEAVDMPYNTMINKLSGRSTFTILEAFRIRAVFKDSFTIDYLFSTKK